MPKEQPKLKRIARDLKGPTVDVGYFYLCNPSANVILTRDKHERLNGRLDIIDCFPLTTRPQPMKDGRTPVGLQMAVKNLDVAGKDPKDPDTLPWVRSTIFQRVCYILAMICGSPQAAMFNMANLFGLPVYGLHEDPKPKAKRAKAKQGK